MVEISQIVQGVRRGNRWPINAGEKCAAVEIPDRGPMCRGIIKQEVGFTIVVEITSRGDQQKSGRKSRPIISRNKTLLFRYQIAV